jgi:hypothetical protein
MDYTLTNTIWVLMTVAIATGHRAYLTRVLVAASPKDRRRSPRRRGNPIAVYLAFPESKSDPKTGRVTDRSMGGLGIATKTKFEVGTILLVCPIKSVGLTPWCQIEVLGRRQVGSAWRLNCRFTNPLPSPMRMLFG